MRDTCIKNGLMVRGIRDSIVMCPPLIITHAEIDRMIDIIARSLREAEPALRALKADDLGRDRAAGRPRPVAARASPCRSEMSRAIDRRAAPSRRFALDRPGSPA